MMGRGYNSTHWTSTHGMMRALRLTGWMAIVSLLVLLPAQRVRAQAASPSDERWAVPSAALAKQIAGLAGPGPATLTVQNSSGMALEQVGAIRRLLTADLQGGGVTVRAAQEGAAIPTAIMVTLSQTAERGVWVAEVQQGAETKVAMVDVPLEVSAVTTGAALMTLRKQMVFRGAGPVLDAEVAPAGVMTELVVLTPESILVYPQSGGQWGAAKTFAVAHTNAFPRDVRGRLTADGGVVRAYLPGTVCEGAIDGAGFACRASDDPWPIGVQRGFYVPARNYFSGVLSPAYGGELGPFYSAAEVPEAGGVATVMSDVKGHVRLLERGAQTEVTGSRDWGSDVAAVKSGCGAGTQVLADAAGDAAMDSLRAYELRGSEAVAVSQTLEMDGAVTAMWPSADGVAATVVTRTAKDYEVWRVAIDCH